VPKKKAKELIEEFVKPKHEGKEPEAESEGEKDEM
jgi:hypothetical protein